MLGASGFENLMSPGASDMGIMSAPNAGGGLLGSIGSGIGGMLKGNYDPQNMLMEKMGIQQPGWMKSMNAIRNMGGIGFSNGKGWFGMQPGGNGSQNILMSALAQQQGGQQGSPQPITLKNEASVTPTQPGMARPVNPMSYRESQMGGGMPPPEFNRLTQY